MAKATPTFDYGSLLERARKDLPEDLADESRWSVPEVDIMYEGRTTIVRNWRDIVDALRRDYHHVLSYLLREIGTAGDGDEDRVIFNGKLAEKQIQDRLDAYVDTFVMCSECHRPDTHLTKDGRTSLLKCDACGAHHPVRARKRKDDEDTTVRMGKTYEVELTATNEKKLPYGMLHGIKIFVPGGKVGDTVKVEIERVLGPTAVAKPLQPR